MDKDSAVLQGAFLQADKLCLPSSLSLMQKADWSRVKLPILQALRDTCGLSALAWQKKVVCVVWLKLMSSEAEEDVEKGWRDNPFFCLQNGLPDVSRAVLLELVKSLSAAPVFARLLLRLPQQQICTELQTLAEHLRTDPSPEDVCFLLEVWWELWKGRDKCQTQEDKDLEMMFVSQFARLSSDCPSVSPQAAKRLKLDLPASSANTDVLHVLLHALKNMKDQVSTTDLCLQSLLVCLDALYTSFLTDPEVVLPVEEKLLILCRLVDTRGQTQAWSPKLLQEALRDLRAAHSPAPFQPSRMTLSQALKIVAELTEFWLEQDLLSAPGCSAFLLQQSVQRVLAALEETGTSEHVTEKSTLRGLLSSLSLPAVETPPQVQAQVAATVISHRLEDCEEFAALFASQLSWTHEELWVDCLEKNHTAFTQPNTLISLSSTLVSRLQRGNVNTTWCRRAIKTAADVFSALSLENQNKVLAAVPSRSSRGFFGCSVPSAVADGFEQELNMAFNCLIQGGGGASAAVSQGRLTTAASLVARVAFQSPEAALRSCCHAAVFNRGAFSLMAKILQQLPGLRGRRGGEDEANGNDVEQQEAGGRGSLFCRCLQTAVRGKPLSACEKEQLLKFLSLLMAPGPTLQGEQETQRFLSPQEVVNTLVLPRLSAAAEESCDAELSLQLLHAALAVGVQEVAPSPHWVLDCSPFPLLYILAQQYNQTLMCWERSSEDSDHLSSMDTKELLESVLSLLGQVMGAEVAAAPSSWSRALFWLYNKVEALDWTVRFHLKPLWGEHFKNEVPLSLLAVCDLPEQEWSGLDLPQYGAGTGLLAWMECCCVSDALQACMLSHLSLDQRQPEHVRMFSKGLLVALTQTLPWCSLSQWSRLLRALRELMVSGRLSVPFSLEYVDFLPMLDLRRFSCELRMSVLLLRVFQLLCSSSCSSWLPADGWNHVGRLYAHAVRGIMSSVKAALPAPPPAAAASPQAPRSTDSTSSVRTPKMHADPLRDTESSAQKLEGSNMAKVNGAPSQEVLFVLSQLFCHVQHIQVMTPGGQSEILFLCSLDILSHYEAVMAAFPDSCSPAESDNTRHFFTTITDNLDNPEMKAVLQQKISQLVSSAA
ncbi:gem-associated protein 4 [Nothobranchius furzeri]|uniref:Gem (Nuclear organelle) associated protein 4 n=1 Tax=Nothobranchius furzeri TaxID=105023 RepID=A0A1A7ZRJ4_NOTFU|nr:gem nuclear organelle associated protein 4 [Nothobranchius furzeri]